MLIASGSISNVVLMESVITSKIYQKDWNEDAKNRHMKYVQVPTWEIVQHDTTTT